MDAPRSARQPDVNLVKTQDRHQPRSKRKPSEYESTTPRGRKPNSPHPSFIQFKKPAGSGRFSPDPAIQTRRLGQSAAARRATRRPPLGKPPLVMTTHAITSFRSSLPKPHETSLL